MAAYCMGLLFLARLAGEDIRKKEIAVYKVFAYAIFAVLYRLVTDGFLWENIIICLIPGGCFLLMSFLTGESIGYGDGMAVMVLGLWTGGWFTVKAVAAGIILSGIFGVLCLFAQRKEPIPFIPFLLLGMEVVLIYA